MSDIINMLKSRTDLYSLQGVSDEDIKEVEDGLGIMFAPDYRDILSEYGVISFDGHELTGICLSPRLNVKDITLKERDNNAIATRSMYVIEVANIDDIVIWQSSDGGIYQTLKGCEPVKICESLLEYINS